MGQKVHPYVLRIGFAKTWKSLWFVDRKKDFARFLEEDLKIRKIIKKAYPAGSTSSIVIERVSGGVIKIKIRTSRPGVIIGRRGQEIEKVKSSINMLTKKEIKIDVEDVAVPELDAQLVAEMISFQLIKRVHFRRAMKRAISQAMQKGCEGIKIRCSGRLGGVEIARSEVYKEGKIPLMTFRSDIDFGFNAAHTTYGTIGIKVWIYQGEARAGTYLYKQEDNSKEKAITQR